MTDLAVECAFKGESGVIGHDEEDGDRLKAIPFPRIMSRQALHFPPLVSSDDGRAGAIRLRRSRFA